MLDDMFRRPGARLKCLGAPESGANDLAGPGATASGGEEAGR